MPADDEKLNQLRQRLAESGEIAELPDRICEMLGDCFSTSTDLSRLSTAGELVTRTVLEVAKRNAHNAELPHRFQRMRIARR